jgi:DedD protein
MAKPVSEEELQLKKRARRRLMGAVVLVAAVAVILPMVLDSEPKPTSQEINIQIPSQDMKGFTSKVVPLTPPVKGEVRGTDKPAAQAIDKPAAQATDKSAEKAADPAKATVAEAPAAKGVEKPAEKTPASKPSPEKPVAKAPEKAVEKAPPSKAGTFFIQVTALADVDRAKLVQQKIIDAGFPAYTQTIPAGKGSVTRVRAGPFAARDEADKAQAALQGMGLEGKVAANP